ncbi:MAG: prepilin-type N-terminal cleavage/methylation domain-containing protein [Candidatus Omnitrophica bacterium]|nr:prepilin-type N-terminal cleavage/methylation domain-containing protein [Candidatus Omnitrophota bacterium]
MIKLLKRKNGMTLLELMFTLGIMLVVILGLVQTYIYCLLLNESNHNLVTATNDAQYVLEQLKAKAYTQLATFTPPAFNNINGESATVLVTPSGTMKSEVDVSVSWTERGRTRNVTLSTIIARTSQ